MRHHGNQRPGGDRENVRPSCMRGDGREALGRRGGGRGAAGEGGGGRGRRRMFESGELRLVLLLLTETEPRHGYDLIRELETRTGGAYSPSPGIIYPTLTLLEDLGLIEARTPESPKKLYAITDAGRAHLADHRGDAETALARLDHLRRSSEALDAGPVFRAMNNLKAALRQRINDQADKQLLFSVADAIDDAARKIERL
jgi:DNA-binding PadR family transcriptional regulator